MLAPEVGVAEGVVAELAADLEALCEPEWADETADEAADEGAAEEGAALELGWARVAESTAWVSATDTVATPFSTVK